MWFIPFHCQPPTIHVCLLCVYFQPQIRSSPVSHIFRIFSVHVDATCFMVVHALAETEEFLRQLLVRVGFGKMRQ